MRNNTTAVRYSSGTIISFNTTASLSGVLVQRDGQSSTIYAVAQYSGFAVGDRVTIVIIGTQAYATGLIR